MKRLSKNAKIMLVVAAVFVVALICIYLFGARHFSTHFFPGTTINGIDCGGMTVSEVKSLLQERIGEYRLELLERGGATEEITGEQLGMEYVDDGGVEALLEQQDGGAWIFSVGGSKTYETSANFSYNQSVLEVVMDGLACFQEENITAPADAYINDNGTAYEIVPEVQGNTLNRDRTKQALIEAIESGTTALDLDAAGLYEAPSVLSTDEGLNAEVTQLNQMTSAQIIYDFADRQMTVNRDTIKGWLVKGEDGSYALDQNQVAEWVRNMAYETDTFGLEHEFKTSLGPTITLAGGGDYGWVIDRDATTAALVQAIQEGQNITTEPVYLYEGKDRSTNDIGDTYVEICITTQTMWCYKDGQLVVETPVVTGDHATGFDTPSGSVWAIDAKKADAQFTLFPVKVAFWLPFNGDCGIHDSTWRGEGEYGGQTYLTDGSHGCVNTPYDAASKIFDAVEIGDPVIVYYSTDQVVGPEPTQEVTMG
ncbi:MAG TPA: L,D-transpeptidase/peptidoglycan binding protein [Candidatus Scatomonas merdavium]|nr:L,D-transpeptidase/peptidoglycan binding protein [Candidatus Scatomonas merdavium]